MFLLLTLPLAAQAQFQFVTNNGAITITGYSGSAGSVSVPNTINGLPVTSIGPEAFYSANLTGVTIPNSVTNIGDGAFDNCTNLTNVTVPNSVGSIGNAAFRNCYSLPSITFPPNVTNIRDNTFRSCTSLTSVTLANNVTNIGGDAFNYCDSLTSFTIPPNVTSIGNNAFYHCTSLTSITIPASVTAIGIPAFSECAGLTTISVAGLNPVYTSVGGVLFDQPPTTLIRCPGGKAGTYAIPNGVTTIGNSAFSSCARLTSVTMPNSVTSLLAAPACPPS